MKSFVITFIFSTIGFGYFLYGRKQQKLISLVSGTVLMVFPFLIDNMVLLIALCLLFLVLPFVIRK